MLFLTFGIAAFCAKKNVQLSLILKPHWIDVLPKFLLWCNNSFNVYERDYYFTRKVTAILHHADQCYLDGVLEDNFSEVFLKSQWKTLLFLLKNGWAMCKSYRHFRAKLKHGPRALRINTSEKIISKSSSLITKLIS